MTQYLIGADEVGFGSLAGKLVVCGLRALDTWKIDGLRDSKKLTPKRRQELRDQLVYEEGVEGNIVIHISERTNKQIDKEGVWNALRSAYVEIFKALYIEGDRIIVDGQMKFDNQGIDYMQIESIPRADDIVPHCMASSIIAKVFRDTYMKEMSKAYVGYGWDTNFGYYRTDHIAAIEKYGITELHRKSYNPVKKMIENGVYKEYQGASK